MPGAVSSITIHIEIGQRLIFLRTYFIKNKGIFL